MAHQPADAAAAQADAQASVLSGLVATADARARGLPARLLIAVVGASVLALAGAGPTALIWFAAMLVSQAIDHRLWAPYRDPARARHPDRAQWIVLCASAAQTTIVYSAFPALMWFRWGEPGKIFAAIWLAGALLHVTMHMHHERRTFLAAIIPHLLYFVGLPAYALLTGDDPGRLGATAILLASILYLVHLVVAFRQYRAASETMRAERELALARQAAAEEASRSKSAFLANMSHEIRTPMNGVLGMAAALEAGDLSPDQAHKLAVIRESGDLLLNILNEILDLSKIEANRIDLERAPFRLSDVARRIESLHGLKAREKRLDFSVEISGDADRLRIGDAHRLVQVLHNLVGNAVKFTTAGEVRVLINASGEDGNADMVEIEVADTGIGMTPEQAARVFDPFAQADTTTTRRYGGTGLGLSIAKGLVEAMGGEIGLHTAPGQGSTFTLRLPAPFAGEREDEKDAARAGGARLEADEIAREVAKLDILAAEDNVVNRSVLASLLGPACRSLAFAGNGFEAIEAFKAGTFDVILMDISMPDMDGVEAMAAIREAEKDRGDARRVPIIAVSAHAMRQQVDHYLSIGFDGYVTKPVSTERLLAEIARVRRASRQAAAA